VSTSEPLVPITTDGVVTIRAPRPEDLGVLEEGRDEEYFRWLAGEESPLPPTACVEVDGEVVGWVDYDTRRSWLEEREVNIGYYTLADHRRRGYATRATALLLCHLASYTRYEVATFAIARTNLRSVAVAKRLGAQSAGTLGDGLYFKLGFSAGSPTRDDPSRAAEG
jgi:RimJ/RimL family protein N-acetyltransferase